MPLYLHVSESFEERGPYNNGPAFVIQQAVYEVAGILQFGQRKKAPFSHYNNTVHLCFKGVK